MKPKQNFYTKVYSIVKKIPKGKVSTYGRIAVIAGQPRAARAVGYALNSLKAENISEVPWQRVINARGEISFKGDAPRAILQKKILIKEGIEFDELEKADLEKYGWP